MFQDLRYGVRMLRKKPVFTLIAALTLALGIGANTAIFSLVNAAFLRPLPVERPEEIFSLNNASLSGENNFPTFSYPNYRDLRDRNHSLSGLFAYRFAPVSLSHDGANERLWGYLVTGNYFDVLGVKPAAGRFFTAEEDRVPGAHPVAVLTYDCWQKRFAGEVEVIGRRVIVNGRSFTIIGVAGRGFLGTEIGYRPEIWFPSMMLSQIEPGNDYLETRDIENFFVQGRLKTGVTPRQAEDELKMIVAQLAREYPRENEGKTILLSPPGLFGSFMRGPVKGFASVLMTVVGVVLLLACTNLANLLLARAAERRKEIAVRLALGAGRTRLIRQLLTENLLLSALGGALGLCLAIWLMDAMMAFRPPIDIPLATELHIDARVLLFTLGVSALTSLAFGLLPALQATRPDLLPALKDEVSRGSARHAWLRSTLVVVQVSLSLVLLICAGLVLRGLERAQQLNPGFVPEGAIEMAFDLNLQGYDQSRTREFKRQLLERVKGLPGVEQAGLSNFVPLSLNINNNPIHLEGQPERRGANVPMVMTSGASPGFIQAIGTRLLEGREMTDQDGELKRRVAVVNETFARRFYPGVSALGKRFSFEGVTGPWIEIVGVMQDGKYFSLSEDPASFIYVNLRPESGDYLTLVARTAGDPVSTIRAIREQFQQLDPALPVYNVKTMVEHMAWPLFPQRVAAMLLGGFGLLALLLATIGMFGVMSYAVTQRTREIGIRLALGAPRGGIFKLIVGHGLKLTALGLGIGLAGAAAGTRLMSNFLYGLSAIDPVTFAGVSLLLTAVAFIACYVPARRAMRVDPMRALRSE